MLLIAALVFTNINIALGLVNTGCPISWVTYNLFCYQFVPNPAVKFDSAVAKCEENGADLVYVTDIKEHIFLKQSLKTKYISNTLWWTGGERGSTSQSVFKWLNDQSRVEDSNDYWFSDEARNKPGTQLVYNKNISNIGWSITERSNTLPYICKISQYETYKIIQSKRGLDYGVEIKNKNDIKRGPVMVIQPKSTVFVSETDSTSVLECLARGNPAVTYKWFKENVEISASTNERYTVTNGRLTISNPHSDDASTNYYCIASNEFGSIFSSRAQLIAGTLGTFSNIAPETEQANEYNFKILQCPVISGKPGVRYHWAKTSVTNYIRTDKQSYTFISNNGGLYFSEIVGKSDAGIYYCVVVLSGSGHYKLTTTQPPSRISKEIKLVVNTGASKADFGPRILNDFIAVLPNSPIIGDDIQMECFAIGTSSSPFKYKWIKMNGQMSSRVSYSSLNRVLAIQNAQLEDEGTYNCIVETNSNGRKSDNKTYTLQLLSKPYFVIKLESQYVEPGEEFSWRCVAEGRPDVTYSWFKDSKKLVSISGDIKINENKLTISKTDEDRHSGMYQCAAENSNGITYSSAQLKFATFAPRFIRYHLPDSTLAARNGEISLICNPDAIPKAEITWSKNGMDLGLHSSQDSTGRLQKLLNGNLILKDIMQNDAGEYKCTATNNIGSASESTKLKIVERLVISRRPSNIEVIVNETAFFYCAVSYDPDFEIAYKWYFNGHPIDIEKNPYYSEGSVENQHGLYVRTARLKHRGNYTCTIQSPLTTDSASAFLNVKGPPGEPGGVYGDETTEDRINIHWLSPIDNGYPITRYIIESSNKLNPEWKMATREIPSSAVIVQDRIFKSFQVVGLQPNNQYRFRVSAINKLGVGLPSLPSADYQTLSSPPKRAPDNVGGGGGKVGDLAMTWTPLPPEEQCAPGIGYVVYWRMEGNPNSKWAKHVINGQASEFYALAGLNFYTLYEVQVQAFNSRGPGPNSTISSIYSAEDLPRAVPIEVAADTYNATAILVTWTPPVNDRATMRGKIAGYQINWLERVEEDYEGEPVRYSQSFFGEITEAVIIGLHPNGYYWVTVQVFNSAGLGPISEQYLGSLGMDAPLHFPTEIRVYSRDSTSVTVKFRGVGFGINESPVSGYKLCYTSVREVLDLTKSCHNIEYVEEGVISDLEKNVLYKLRVMAYSVDGDGKKSESIYFTLGGQITFDPQSYSILAGTSTLTYSLTILSISFLLHIILNK